MSENNQESERRIDKYQNLESYSDMYIFYPIADSMMPFLHDKIGFKPNDITTLGFLVRLISAVLIIQKKYAVAAVTYLIGYVFDAMDGRMARKYKETSLFGEAWDSVSDTVSTVAVIAALIYSVRGRLEWWQVAMLIVFVLLVNVWNYTLESWSVFQKTGNYDVLQYKKDKFKNEVGFIQDLYIYINDKTMEFDKMMEKVGGFEKHKDALLSAMPVIGCGNYMILLAIIIASFVKNSRK